MIKDVVVPDPFEVCQRFVCGHRRRCHDNVGCGKWIGAEARSHLDGSGYGALLYPAHTCTCTGFVELPVKANKP